MKKSSFLLLLFLLSLSGRFVSNTEGWAKLDKSKWDKINLIGRWTGTWDPNYITVLGPYRERPYRERPYRERFAIFGKIVSVPIGNAPKFW